MGNSNYAFTKRNEFGDEFRYKSGTGNNSKWIGTRMCLGKRERRTFTGDNRDAIEQWAEWCHECEREAPQEPQTPVVPVQYRVKEEDLPTGQRISDETRAEIEELLEVGDMSQKEIAEAYGLGQASVSRIKSQLEERLARHEERQRVREEERQLREEERERDKPEPLPDNFKPRVQAPTEGAFWVVAESVRDVTLFSDKSTAEKVARMLNQATGGSFVAVECKRWEEV